MPRRCPPAVPGASSRRAVPCRADWPRAAPAPAPGAVQPPGQPQPLRAVAAGAAPDAPLQPCPCPVLAAVSAAGARPRGVRGWCPAPPLSSPPPVTSRRTRGRGVTGPRLPGEVGLPALAGFLRGRAARGPWADEPWTVSSCVAGGLGLSSCLWASGALGDAAHRCPAMGQAVLTVCTQSPRTKTIAWKAEQQGRSSTLAARGFLTCGT